MLLHRTEVDKLRRVVSLGNPGLLAFHLAQNFHLPLLAGYDEVVADEDILSSVRSPILPIK